MSRHIGCETARELLDAFLDDELAVEEQVLVESHLRWCRTCALRVEDIRLIGEALRAAPTVTLSAGDDTRVLDSLHAGVLMRVRVEHEQSFGVRARDLCSDMRLFWPALGATTALVISVVVAAAVFTMATEVRAESLAEMIKTLAQPGTERNPMRPDNGVRSIDQYLGENRPLGGISIPRALDNGAMFEGIGEGDNLLSAIVTPDGRVARWEVLSDGGEGGAGLAHAVRESRFAPAQTSLGSKVTVNMVWLITSTQVVTKAAPDAPRVIKAIPETVRPQPQLVPDLDVPVVVPEADGQRLSAIGSSATA